MWAVTYLCQQTGTSFKFLHDHAQSFKDLYVTIKSKHSLNINIKTCTVHIRVMKKYYGTPHISMFYFYARILVKWYSFKVHLSRNVKKCSWKRSRNPVLKIQNCVVWCSITAFIVNVRKVRNNTKGIMRSCRN